MNYYENIKTEILNNEITKKVKDIISKTWRGRRLVAAFPNVNIEVIREKIRKKVEESKKEIEKRKEEIANDEFALYAHMRKIGKEVKEHGFR